MAVATTSRKSLLYQEVPGHSVVKCYETDFLHKHRCSVRRNICYGLEEEDGIAQEDQPSQEQIEEAAKLANAHEFISALPRGYDMARANFIFHLP